jgi:hypothetical protein
LSGGGAWNSEEIEKGGGGLSEGDEVGC